MPITKTWLAIVAIGLTLISCHGLRAAEIDFAHDVAPILREHCGKCHTGDKKQGGFSMNTRELLLAGGENGKAVVPGKSAQSDLLARITSSDPDLQMPPEGARVPAEKVALIKKWIDAGVPWQEGFAFKAPVYEPPLKPRRPELPPAIAGRNNPIDRIIDAYIAEHRLPPLEGISDAAFLRRASLDIVGLLPPPERLQQFLADRSPDKRQQLVRELLADDTAYADHWLTFWNDLLRNDYTGTGFITGGRKQITKWLYQSLLDNKPYDQFVRELISPTAESEGFIQGIRWRGDVNASQTNEVQFAQSISQSLLGINMKCASCHDSFIDNWKLDQAYSLAAIYATGPLAIYRCDKPTGQQATPAWIFPELGQVDPKAPQAERLKQLAALMTHKDNGRFTRTIVNRVWHRLMGRGIVHPVDAMHTEPWSADLLDYLAVHLADNGHDLKKTIELICTSQAYQGRVPVIDEPAAPGDYVFRGPLARRMSAEQFVDALWQLTDTAPARPDAAVLRGTKRSGEASADVKNTPLQGKWIWSYAEASSAVPKAGETITLRRSFDLPAAPSRGVGVITCDNSYTLFVNGAKVGADDNWETVEAVSLDASLKAGANEIIIVAKNAGAGPNPAALYFEARLEFSSAKEKQQTLATDESWEWSSAAPNARGRFAKAPDDWKPAAAVANPGVWSARVGAELAETLAGLPNGPVPMVRASLVKSDFLMRALGRPNRDQIVTMRPADFTTLEAIDLANGQILTETLARGAAPLLAKRGTSPEALARWLYSSALSRLPTDDELALAREILGEKATAESVQDFLWVVLMLPEFQLVR